MNWFSSVGLLLDIVGVLFLFEYGLPSKIKDHGGSLLREENSEEEIDRQIENKKVKRRSYFGLTLILVGFVLQFVGTNYDWFVSCILPS